MAETSTGTGDLAAECETQHGGSGTNRPFSMGAATVDGDSSLPIFSAAAVVAVVAVGLVGERLARTSSSKTDGLDGKRPCFSSGTTSWLMSMVETEFMELDLTMCPADGQHAVRRVSSREQTTGTARSRIVQHWMPLDV